ncbi:hypothetical protein DM02DRAFT_657843 [Periconia macrospinosa]|uniref:DUF6536 domain-containing protein n=1 Tax=Periconia macrospinosa TaxID=97972 RepID=A0A2V1DI38_9PLEO|nr:hypothetical protein DM02DRAFT_657843 [Periconia macrospinosa]
MSSRAGLLGCAVLSAIVLALNVGMVAWASNCPPSEDNTKILYDGSCSTSAKANIAAHAAINVLSTLLLGASNYSMQIAMAPSRADVDKAHSKRRALTIGVPTLKNFRNISILRRLCWELLALSSIPLHLVYNSSILATKVATEYLVTELDESFLQTGISIELPGLSSTTVGQSGVMAGTGYTEVKALFDRILREAHAWENLTLEQCAQSYTPFLLNSRRTLVLVTPSTNDHRALPGLFRMVGSKTWMCDDRTSISPDKLDADGSAAFPCSPKRAIFGYRDHDTNWQEPSNPIYCLAEPHRQKCTVEAFRPFLIVISVFNAIKFVSILWLYFNSSTRHSKLHTLGDAVVSFLNHPDDSTKNLCALDKVPLEKKWRTRSSVVTVRWTRRSQRRADAISGIQCIVSIIMFLIAICGIIILLGKALSADNARGTLQSAFRPSSFTSNQNLAIVGFESLQNATLTGLVVLVNIPQLVFSVFYVFYNSLLSIFLQASEWNAFSLVCGYSVPLLLFSTSIHFLISQAIFLSRISFLDFLGRPSQRFGALGYGNMYGAHPGQLLAATYFSPAILAVLVLSITAFLALLFIGSKKLPGNMVMAAGSSAVIAAACHQRDSGPRTVLEQDSEGNHGDEAATKALKWGDVGYVLQIEEDVVYRHLQFSTRDVMEPSEGAEYA